MELTDFLNEAFIKTFSGTLISIEIIVFVTKSLPLIKKIPTRVYTFVLSLAHLIIVKVSLDAAPWSVEGIYILILNALAITVILCGGYDSIMLKIQGIDGKTQASTSINGTSIDKATTNSNETTITESTNTHVGSEEKCSK